LGSSASQSSLDISKAFAYHWSSPSISESSVMELSRAVILAAVNDSFWGGGGGSSPVSGSAFL